MRGALLSRLFLAVLLFGAFLLWSYIDRPDWLLGAVAGPAYGVIIRELWSASAAWEDTHDDG